MPTELPSDRKRRRRWWTAFERDFTPQANGVALAFSVIMILWGISNLIQLLRPS